MKVGRTNLYAEDHGTQEAPFRKTLQCLEDEKNKKRMPIEKAGKFVYTGKNLSTEESSAQLETHLSFFPMQYTVVYQYLQ